MSEVYFVTDPQVLPTAFDTLGIEDFRSKKVLVKLHMGEPGNKYFISPSIVKRIIEKLNSVKADPFLFDTTVAYPGPRSTASGYTRVAVKHGFGRNKLGCDIIIGDRGVKVVEGGYSFDVAREIYEATHLVVVSHVKGHFQSGFGGALKNLGMGGMTREMKRRIHHWSNPVLLEERCDLCGSCAGVCSSAAIAVDAKWKFISTACEGCGKCVPVCPNEALSHETMDLQKGFALSAKACTRGKRTLYVNALVGMSRDCDCDPNAGPVLCPDIGYLVSNGLAAIDRASLDLVNGIKPDVFLKTHGVDPLKQVRFAEELGFPSSYQLIKL